MKAKFFISLSAIVVMAVLLPACSDNDSDEGPQSGSEPFKKAEIELSRSEADIAAGINSFGLKLFNEVARDPQTAIESPNFAVSPVSFALCMSLMANGMDEAFQDEVAGVLNAGSIDALNDMSLKLMSYLPYSSETTVFKLANAVWYAPELSPVQKFAGIAKNSFKASPSSLDFKNPSSVDVVNKWCSDNTEGVIKEAVRHSDIVAAMTLFANALYFNDKWSDPFDKKKTADATFHGVTSDAQVAMMHNSIKTAYCETPMWSAVILSYKGPFEMMLFLPAEGSSIAALSASLSTEDLGTFLENAQIYNVNLTLPKFESAFDGDCMQYLANLGLNRLPESLDGFICPPGKSEIKGMRIKHITKVSTDEIGTVAAAVTISMTLGSAGVTRSVDMTFNRPFVYLIRNTATGSIIMAGQYTQP